MAAQFERDEVDELHLAEVPVQMPVHLPEQPSPGGVVVGFEADTKAFVGGASVPHVPTVGEGLLQQQAEMGLVSHAGLQPVWNGIGIYSTGIERAHPIIMAIFLTNIESPGMLGYRTQLRPRTALSWATLPTA